MPGIDKNSLIPGPALKNKRMKIRHIIAVLAAVTLLTGCDALKQQAVGAYNFTKCKYEYKSISNLSIAGMDLSKGISLIQAPQIISLLSGQSKSIPLSFVVNMDVTNPAETAAMMNGLHYVLSIDGVQFTTGSINSQVNVPGGGKQNLPLTIGFDVLQLMQGESVNAVSNAVMNFIGMGSEKSNVSLQVKPTFMVAGVPIDSPAYIPVNFSFGGAKNQ